MKTSDFDYFLPPELVAQTPIENREDSRLLVYDRASGAITHDRFYNIVNYLSRGDLLCLNNTRVLPARLYGKTESGATVEILLLKCLGNDTWQTLAKPGKKAKAGTKITFSPNLKANVLGTGEEGTRTINFVYSGDFNKLLAETGEMPLPHYIKEKLSDGERYQTVYSEIAGSAAAPTAGLHFTPRLLQSIVEKGVDTAKILLHVGLGTFRPVKSETIEEHKMHSEHFEITEEAAEKINAAKSRGGKIVAVGTTSVRTLESVAGDNGYIKSRRGETDIFIYPGYKFKCVDAVITNFHLPKSTLIMLVSAFAGRENTLRVYEEAVREKYRFYSFGDAMIIL